MRTLAVLLLVLGVPALPAAPLPFPKATPEPKSMTNPHWEIDFTPLSKAGNVRISLRIIIRTASGESNLSVSQSGRVSVGALINVLSRSSFQKDDLVVDPAKTRMAVKAFGGKPVTGIEVAMTGLAQEFAPVVHPPGERK